MGSAIPISLRKLKLANRDIALLSSNAPQNSEDKQQLRIDVNQLVSNDVIKAWNGALKSYTQLVICPICMSVLFGVFGSSPQGAFKNPMQQQGKEIVDAVEDCFKTTS